MAVVVSTCDALVILFPSINENKKNAKSQRLFERVRLLIPHKVFPRKFLHFIVLALG